MQAVASFQNSQKTDRLNHLTDKPTFLTDPKDPTTKVQLLNAEEAANALGASIGTLFSKTREGHLHKIRVKNRVYYNPYEIESLRERLHQGRRPGRPLGLTVKSRITKNTPVVPEKRPVPTPLEPNSKKKQRLALYQDYPGETAASATELFMQGRGVCQVVIELKIGYELAEHLHAQWKKHSSNLTIDARQVDYLSKKFGWNQTPPTPEDFLNAINRQFEDLVHQDPPKNNPLTKTEEQLLAEAEAQAIADGESLIPPVKPIDSNEAEPVPNAQNGAPLNGTTL